MKKILFPALLAIVGLWAIQSCKHEPILDDINPDPNDTITNPLDTITGCAMDTITYSNPILPLLEAKCYACHSGTSIQGNLDLSKFDQLTAVIENGSFWGSLLQEDTVTWEPMPYLSPPLDSCSLAQINAWIQAGYDPDIPVDTTVVEPPDTVIVENPCLPGTIYFSRDVLPLLITYCGDSQCHDAINPEEGVNMTTYNQVMNTGEVTPGDPSESEFWEEMMLTNDNHMPPYNQPQLSANQLQIIENWILQGAQNLTCNEVEPCDTTNVSYATDILPILQNKCLGCHSGSTPANNLNLSTYASVVTIGNNGKLLGALNGLPGFADMPPNLPLPQCQIDKITSWVNAGMPNN